MGLFSNKKKVHSGISVSRMYEDADIQSVRKIALLDYTLSNDKRVDALGVSINDTLNTHMKGSIGSTALSLHKWAKNHYHYGVYEGYKINKGSIDFKSIATNYLKDRLGISATVAHAKLGPINNSHATWQILADKYGYNFEDNSLTYSGSKWILEGFTISYCKDTADNVVNADFLNPLGIPDTHGVTPARLADTSRVSTSWIVDEASSYDYVTVSLAKYTGKQITESTNLKLDFLSYEYSGAEVIGDTSKEYTEYLMVQYVTAGAFRVTTLAYSEDAMPSIAKEIVGDVDPGKYLPQIYVVLDGKPLHDMALQGYSEEAFKSSKKLCKRLDVNYKEVCSSIYDQVKDEEAVQNAFITFQLAVNTKDSLIHEYMYHFFYEMYKDSSKDPERSQIADLKNSMISYQTRAGISVKLADKVTYTGLSYQSIGVRVVKGSIGAIGFCNGGYEKEPIKSGNSWYQKLTVGKHIFRMQITDNTYREVAIYGLSVSTQVNNASDVVGNNSDEHLLIPIDVDIIRKRMYKHRHELLCKSMHVVITTRTVTVKKWYQTGIFKVIMFVIAVVVAYFNPPAGMAMYSAITAAYAVVVSIAISLAVSFVVRILAKLGIEGGIVYAIIAVIAIVVGGYAGVTNSSVAGLNSTQYMAIANASFAASNNAMQLELMKKVKAYEEFKDYYEKELEALDDLRKELDLDSNVQLDIFNLLSSTVREPDIRLGESPVSFLERTTSVSAGMMPIHVVNNFVYLTTQLPTFESLMAKRDNSYDYIQQSV